MKLIWILSIERDIDIARTFPSLVVLHLNFEIEIERNMKITNLYMNYSIN